jgi:hypothetical protein
MTATPTGPREITYDNNGMPSEFPPFEWTDSSDADPDVISHHPMPRTPEADSGYRRIPPPTAGEVHEHGLLNMGHNPAGFTIYHFVPHDLPSAADDFAEPPCLRVDTSAFFGEAW